MSYKWKSIKGDNIKGISTLNFKFVNKNVQKRERKKVLSHELNLNRTYLLFEILSSPFPSSSNPISITYHFNLHPSFAFSFLKEISYFCLWELKKKYWKIKGENCFKVTF